MSWKVLGQVWTWVTYDLYFTVQRLKFFHLGQFLSKCWSTAVILGTCRHLSMASWMQSSIFDLDDDLYSTVHWQCCHFLSNYWSYSQWHLAHAYILVWSLECSHSYLTLIYISWTIRHACYIVLSIIMNLGQNFIFYGHSLPLIQEEQLSVSGERMCTILVNCLED